MELATLLAEMGTAGQRLAHMRACEGAAGNLSLCVREAPPDLRAHFPQRAEISLPCPAPALENACIVVSGSGARLPAIAAEPLATLACVQIQPGGERAILHTHPSAQFARVTSEFNSHLAVHHDHVPRHNLAMHALAHAQPVHLTYLSHLPRYQEQNFLNARLLRWQPETIFNLPEGIAVLPYLLTGSADLMRANLSALHTHRLALWSKHGVMARAETLAHAIDLIDYAEAAAHYEYLNLALGDPQAGMSVQEILDLCAAYHIPQTVF
jgi:rhamnulose-1-phosphate aldolase